MEFESFVLVDSAGSNLLVEFIGIVHDSISLPVLAFAHWSKWQRIRLTGNRTPNQQG